MKEALYTCKYCHTDFTHEDRYMKHKCKQMLREEELRTAIGQAAWLYYEKWMRYQRKAIPPASAFLKSRYFRSFIKFAELVKSTHMTETEPFIRLMIEKTMQPSIWCNDQVYSMYLEHLEFNTPPLTQITTTVRTMSRLADLAECSLEEVFDNLPMSEIIHLIRQYKLSPWILLNSIKFKAIVQQSSEEEREILGSLIRPAFWRYKFEKSPDILKIVQKCVKELNI
jgi:hypothetical protein